MRAANFPEPRTWGRQMPVVQQARALLFVWAGLILFFFSLTSGSRMEYYSFGAWPAIAIMLGNGIAKAEETHDQWLTRLQGGLAMVGLSAAACLGYLVWQSRGIPASGDISELMNQYSADNYRLSMSRFLDITSQTFAVLRGPSIMAILVFIFGFGGAWWLRRHRRLRRYTHDCARHGSIFLRGQLGVRQVRTLACRRESWLTRFFFT